MPPAKKRRKAALARLRGQGTSKFVNVLIPDPIPENEVTVSSGGESLENESEMDEQWTDDQMSAQLLN